MTPETAPRLTVQDVAELLGVDEETVRRKARSGEWLAVKVCGRYRFRPVDVDAIPEPIVPNHRTEPPPSRRRRVNRPPGVGSLASLDEIEREEGAQSA